MRTGKVMGRKNLDGTRAVRGIAVSLAVTIALAMADAALVNVALIGESWMDEMAALILLLSAFAGAMAVSGGGERSLALVTGLGYWAVLMGLQLLLFPVSVTGMGAMGLVILGGVGAALLLKPKGRPGYRGRRRPYR